MRNYVAFLDSGRLRSCVCPDQPPADELRPGPAGDDKLEPITIDDSVVVRIRTVTRFSASSVPRASEMGFDFVASRFRPPELFHLTFDGTNAVIMSVLADLDGLRAFGEYLSSSYISSVAAGYSTAAARLLLDDFDWGDSIHRDAMIQYVQSGVDLAQAVHGGGAQWDPRPYPEGSGYHGNGAGGHHPVQRLPILFAAFVTGDPQSVLVDGSCPRY